MSELVRKYKDIVQYTRGTIKSNWIKRLKSNGNGKVLFLVDEFLRNEEFRMRVSVKGIVKNVDVVEDNNILYFGFIPENLSINMEPCGSDDSVSIKNFIMDNESRLRGDLNIDYSGVLNFKDRCVKDFEYFKSTPYYSMFIELEDMMDKFNTRNIGVHKGETFYPTIKKSNIIPLMTIDFNKYVVRCVRGYYSNTHNQNVFEENFSGSGMRYMNDYIDTVVEKAKLPDGIITVDRLFGSGSNKAYTNVRR